MPKITIHADCGNAPKKLALSDLNVAFAESNVAVILEHFTDDIHWHFGEADMRGKGAVRAVLEAMKDDFTTKLVIHSITPHGTEGVVNGVIKTEEGNPAAFCGVCRFVPDAGTKIESMKSFAIYSPSGG